MREQLVDLVDGMSGYKGPIVFRRLLLIFEFTILVMEYMVGNVLPAAPLPLSKIALLPANNTSIHLLLHLFIFYHDDFCSKAILLSLVPQ
jgi:hypothetical protein